MDNRMIPVPVLVESPLLSLGAIPEWPSVCRTEKQSARSANEHRFVTFAAGIANFMAEKKRDARKSRYHSPSVGAASAQTSRSLGPLPPI